MSQPRVILFGTLGVFSYFVLRVLIKHKINVAAVVIPGATPLTSPVEKFINIPILQQPQHDTIELLAIKHDIPTIYAHDIGSATLVKSLQAMAPDFMLVACFPYILPPALFNLPRVACLNIHPSLLPAYRGPTPLFWQLKNGERVFGVTLHNVSQKIDAGNIVIQRETHLRDGMRGRAIDAHLGLLGARLFIESLALYEKKNYVPKIQDQALASYQHAPSRKDFRLDIQWNSRRAFNFMRGTGEWKQPYALTIGDSDFRLVSPNAYSPAATIKQAYIIEDNIITIQFAQGLLKATLKL